MTMGARPLAIFRGRCTNLPTLGYFVKSVLPYAIFLAFLIHFVVATEDSLYSRENPKSSSVSNTSIDPAKIRIVGYWQFKKGDPLGGAIGIASIPMVIGGSLLVADYLKGFGEPTFAPSTQNGLNYLLYKDAYYNSPDKWKLYLGSVLALAGTYAYVSTLYRGYVGYNQEFGLGLKDAPPEGPVGLLLSPFRPKEVFNFQVFPVFPLLAFLGSGGIDWQKFNSFFQSKEVPFMGTRVSPGGGVALMGLSAAVMVGFNAAWEEIFFRGVAQDRMGFVGQSLLFGATHGLNVTAPNTSIEGTANQVIFATLFGLYAGYQVKLSRRNITKMIALHFWHNVTSMLLSYITDPTHQIVFRIQTPVITF